MNYWMHAGLLTMKGEKMSKSVGNVVGLREVIDTYGAMPLRFFFLNVHYRSPLDFVPGKSLEEAQGAYATLAAPRHRLAAEIDAAGPDRSGHELAEAVADEAMRTVEAMDDALADDFNTREAIARLFSWGRTLSEWSDRLPSLSSTALQQLAAPYRWAGDVLGLWEEGREDSADERLRPLVEVAIAARQRARERGEFDEADRIRAALAEAGIEIEDAGGTTRWRLGEPARR